MGKQGEFVAYFVKDFTLLRKYIEVFQLSENNPSQAVMAYQVSISKSKYLSGLQCHKLLWFYYHAKDEIPAPDAAQQAIFDQGQDVGALAKKMFPDGVEIGAPITDLAETIRLSNNALKLRKTLFEAAFSANGCYARVDILSPAKGNAWDIIEVKSATSLKEVNLADIAFQAWVLAKAGLKVRRCVLCYVNNDFVRNGEIDLKQLFTLADITPQVAGLTRHVEEQVGEMFKTIRRQHAPEIQIGPHCSKPYTCPLHGHCWSFLPDASVFTLYRGGKKSYTLLKQGIHHLEAIPAEFKLTPNQQIQRRTLRTGAPHVDRPAIAAFLKQLIYPISYLDFETFATAIPMFDYTRPYQQVPFQFSLYVVHSKNAQPEHCSFLAEGTADPRPTFMLRLREALPETGSVVTYNASFEKKRLKECAELLPEFKPWVSKVTPRIVDLLLPFRGFRYYHPQQHGSASMKAVLPALTGKGYEHLAIQEGGAASREFLRVTHGQVTAAERRRVRQHLEAYCALDTMGMVAINNCLCTLSDG